MIVPPVCRACHPALCRRPLQTRSRPRAPHCLQWHSRATFISLSGSSNKDPPTTTDEGANITANASTAKPGALKGRRALLLNQSKRRMPKDLADPGYLLESLFEQTLTSPNPSTDETVPKTASLQSYKHVESLKKMLAEKNSAAESYYFFVEHFGPDALIGKSVDRHSMPSYLHTTATQLIRVLIYAKAENPLSQSLPTVTEVTRLYAQLNILRGTDWTDMVLNLVGGLLKVKKEDTKDNSVVRRLTTDLLGAWNIVCRRPEQSLKFPTINSPSLDWTNIPNISIPVVINQYQSKDMQQAFGLLTPGFRSGHIDNVPITAIATLVLLTKDTICGEVVSGAAPFIHALRNVVAVCDSDISKIAATRSLGTGPVPDYVTREWPSIKELVAETPTTLPEKSSSSLEASHKYVRLSIFKRLQDALGKRDASQVDRLWADAEQLQVSHDENDENGNPSASGQSKRYNGLTPVLCNQFILVYMALRKPNRAVDVWNHMVAKSLNPTAATWNAMLGGCKASKDVNALETVWDKMQASSIKPDTGCWTTRISGLVDCGHIDAALSALEDMGKRWLREKTEGYKSARAGAAEPTIATINAVVAGLLRKQKPDAAYRVLAWADKLGISPDVITFNTLLRPLIREGRSKQASTLLQQMQKSGVEADVATFTTIIDETLSSADKKTPEQQIKVISGVLSKMEKSGVQANMHTYGKLIYQLLRTSPGDLTAVNAILERMFEKGLQPSTHIYTMLLEHYFSQSPPDLGAVRGLIERTRLQHGSTDHVFWDRVIEGYARAGETALAMQVLGRLNNKKNMAGWITLRTLLGALVENEEWDAARTLVSNTVADRGGPISQVERGREGQHLFWELAEQLGII